MKSEGKWGRGKAGMVPLTLHPQDCALGPAGETSGWRQSEGGSRAAGGGLWKETVTWLWLDLSTWVCHVTSCLWDV